MILSIYKYHYCVRSGDSGFHYDVIQ